MPTRRNVLVGLGALLAGGGALFATGAFTTVEAQRTVNVETAGDANAFLGLTPARPDGAWVAETGGTIEIQLDSDAGGATPTGEGLSQNAINTFNDIVEISNNGTQAINSLEFEFAVTGSGDDAAHQDALMISIDGQRFADGSAATGDVTGDVTMPGADENALDVGETIDFGVVVDLQNHGITDIDESAEVTMTIIADTT